jgi:membrane protein implicated in regulation of membrane protease activity
VLLAASPAEVIGNSLLLLGIILALAAGLPFYSARESWSDLMVKLGLVLSCLGACFVLIVTAVELRPRHGFWQVAETIILALIVLAVLAILLAPVLHRCVFSRVEEADQDDEDDEAEAPDAIGVLVVEEPV